MGQHAMAGLDGLDGERDGDVISSTPASSRRSIAREDVELGTPGFDGRAENAVLLAGHGPEVKAPRVTRRVDGRVYLHTLAAYLGRNEAITL